jgi:hypothetical protein
LWAYREDTTLSDKFVSELLWFYPRTPVSSTNKTDRPNNDRRSLGSLELIFKNSVGRYRSQHVLYYNRNSRTMLDGLSWKF